MKISFIGTGLLGNPMAEKILENTKELIVFNRTIEKTKNLKDNGAFVAKTSAEAIMAGDLIILMVSDGKAVSEILFHSEVNDFSGKTIIQMSTISPEESKKFHSKILQNGGEYFESPVLGSIPEAKQGKLQVMVGGTNELYNRYKDFLSIMGEVYYIGQVGQASTLKLALNQLIASLTSAFSLSLGMILKAGIDPENSFMAILRNSGQYAPNFDKKLPLMLSGNFDQANFPVKHLLKDVKLIRQTAESFGLDYSALKGVEQILNKSIEMGNAEKDYSALFSAVNS